jgi:sugar lactone lactonase YvrE
MKRNSVTTIIVALGLLISSNMQAQHSLEKIWQTDTLLKFPEEVVFEPNGKFLYVTNTDGNPMAADGTGSVGKIGLNGEVIEVDWVKGLDAPKGMRLYKNLLYIADLSNVVVVDVDKAEIVKRIAIDSARLLHNVAIDSQGIVYVSDLFGGKIYRIEAGNVSIYLDGLQGPAGILLDESDMYIFTAEGLLKADASKTVTTVSKGMDRRANGIVKVAGKEFIVTCWGGHVYYVYFDGSNQLILDTSKDMIPAGINLYDPRNKIMYMTTDQHNVLIAYKLK